VDAVPRVKADTGYEAAVVALTHVHRYQLAAELCAGLRVVDIVCGGGDGAEILSESAAELTEVECGDAKELLDRDLSGEFDAVIVFEALQRLDDIDTAIDALGRHAAAGLMVIASLPNSTTFREQQQPHDIRDFDIERAREAFRRIGASTFLYQFHADGSLIRGPDDGPLAGASTMQERAEPEHANHLIAIANPPAGYDESSARARVRLGVAPVPNTHMLDLERANRRLLRTNRELARERLGVADSAAAAALDRIRSRGGAGLAGQSATRRLASRVKRAVTLIVPHGIVLTVMRLRAERDRERALGPDRR
jgi:hypothetical protein